MLHVCICVQRSGGAAPNDVITHRILADEEEGLPFADETFDLAVSSLRCCVCSCAYVCVCACAYSGASEHCLSPILSLILGTLMVSFVEI